MDKKIGVSSCNGMSNFGLIARTVSADLSNENQGIISICLVSTIANDVNHGLINKYPIVSLNGCSNECVNKMLKAKGCDIHKSINMQDFADKNDFEEDVSRLGEDGEKIVKKIKDHILKEIDSNNL